MQASDQSHSRDVLKREALARYRVLGVSGRNSPYHQLPPPALFFVSLAYGPRNFLRPSPPFVACFSNPISSLQTNCGGGLSPNSYLKPIVKSTGQGLLTLLISVTIRLHDIAAWLATSSAVLHIRRSCPGSTVYTLGFSLDSGLHGGTSGNPGQLVSGRLRVLLNQTF